MKLSIPDKMKWPLQLAMVLVALLFVVGCAGFQQQVYHGVLMRGSIVNTSGSEVVLCIGSSDGAKVGQELTVHKIITEAIGTKQTTYRKENTGAVRITEIFNEHFAKAVIVSGKQT